MENCFKKGVWLKTLNKKSQIGFIVFLLILLISIILIILVWNLINILVESKSSEINPELLVVNLDIKDVIVFITGSSKVSVHRGTGGEMDGLKFAFYSDSGSKVIDVLGVLNELETETYSFDPQGIGNISSVSVFPILENKIGREFITEKIDLFEVPSGLVSWWRFDDSRDFVGSNDGSLIRASIEEGILILNENGYFEVSDDSSLDMNDKLTISAWIKSNSDNGKIIEKGDNYKLKLENRKIVFSFNEDGNLNKFESIDEIDEDWNHVAVSLSWKGVLNIYINGGLVKTENIIASPDLNDLELKIGDGFVGEIDEVMIFNRDLSVGQVRGLYEFGRE